MVSWFNGYPGWSLADELVKKYSDRMRIAAQFEVERKDQSESAGVPQLKTIKEQCLAVLSALSIDKIDFFFQKPGNHGLDVSTWMAELKVCFMPQLSLRLWFICDFCSLMCLGDVECAGVGNGRTC